jgi:hypothetical protein
MNVKRDPDLLIRQFLDDGLVDLPDRSYDTVRSAIEHTRQRVVLGPWSVPELLQPARLAFVAAALVGLAVLGITFLPREGGIGNWATPSVSPTPNVTPLPLPMSDTGLALAAGTYAIDDPDVTPVKMVVTVPSGWQTVSAFLFKTRGTIFDETTISLSHWRVTNVYSDPCRWGTSLSDPPVGPTVDDLANALADQVGRSATEPVDITIDGYVGKKVDSTVPTNLDATECDNDEYKTFSTGPFPGDYGGFVYAPGQRDTFYVLDVEGERILIHALYQAGTSQTDRADLQSMVDSIRLEP